MVENQIPLVVSLAVSVLVRLTVSCDAESGDHFEVNMEVAHNLSSCCEVQRICGGKF